MTVSPDDVLTFWANAGPPMWFKKDDGFDREISERFLSTMEEAAAGKLSHWTTQPDSALALILILDQFSRNVYRNDARAFAQDPQCVDIVHQLIKSGDDRRMRDDLVVFAYMPLMHSESLEDQEQCIVEMERLGLENNVKYAVIHRDIIKRFGRFPHRNSVLGRETTAEEQAFLDDGGFSG